jgi:hypothetical protein
MEATPRSISRHVILELFSSAGSALVEAELRYDADDPYAVAVAFQLDGSELVWVFGRDLMLRGVAEPAGDGDVQIFPSLDDDGRLVVVLQLSSPSGLALVEAKARDVIDFLASTRAAVWPGTESNYLRLDDAIQALLVDD